MLKLFQYFKVNLAAVISSSLVELEWSDRFRFEYYHDYDTGGMDRTLLNKREIG